MKATITFDLDNQEDRERHRDIANDEGGKLRHAMWNFAQDVLRKYRKYGIETAEVTVAGLTPEEAASIMADHIETKFYEALKEAEAKID
jgi:hypothetical protein